MKFIFPSFLFALFAIAIPVIIHLFSFRQYKTVYFSNVSFLREIKNESNNKSKLKQLLILIARILAITFLVFAFAQPYFPQGNVSQKNAQNIVGIYIDNSFSMNALSEKGQLLEVARNKALEICLAHPASTKFRLLTNDLEQKHQHLLNREQFIRQVAEIKPSPAVIPLSMITARFATGNLLPDEAGASKQLYFLSDFQKTVTDFENFGNKEIVSWFMPLKAAEIANIYIDSCWFEIPAHYLKQEEEIFVRIKNSSSQSFQNLPLKIMLNDSIKSITNFSISERNEITTSLKYTNNTGGLQLGQIEISDYPFTHDNNWYISYNVEQRLKALAIFDNSDESKDGIRYLSALFNNDSYVQLDLANIKNMQISKLSEYNTIFIVNAHELSSGINSELRNAVANGSSLVIFPSSENFETTNGLLTTLNAAPINAFDTTSQKISGIDFENDFFTGVFSKKAENPVLPETRGHFQFAKINRQNDIRLLWFQNNDPALTFQPYEKGKVWVFSFPLGKISESFTRDVLFVPVAYNIVLKSLPNDQTSMVVGKDNFYQLKNTTGFTENSVIEIIERKTKERFVPGKNFTGKGVVFDFTGFIKNDGHFLVQNEDSVIAAAAYNYDRAESNLSFYSIDELNTQIETLQMKNAGIVENTDQNFAEIFDDIQHGKLLWKWFIIMAILMVLAEAAIIRFWKNTRKT